MPNPTKQFISLLTIAPLLLTACTPLQTPTAAAPNRAATPDEITVIGLKRSAALAFAPATN